VAGGDGVHVDAGTGHVVPLLSLYFLDILDPAERRTVAGHLDRCAPCATEYASIARISGLLEALDEPDLVDGYPRLAGIPDRARTGGPARRTQPWTGWRAAGTVAAALLGAGAVWAWAVRSRPRHHLVVPNIVVRLVAPCQPGEHALRTGGRPD
jgi:anti-sigma factor RsiW